MRALLLAVLALAVPAATRAEPATPSPVPPCPELVVTGHHYYPPVAWSSGGKIVGAAPELVVRIASGLGVAKVTSRDFGSWEKAQAAARSGEADVIVGIYRNAERTEYLDYVDPPFLVDPVSIVVRADAPFRYAEWGDLQGRKGVTSAGESYGTAFDNFMARSLTVTRVPGIDKAFAAVLDGTADYAIVAFYPGRDAARKAGLFEKLAFLPRTVVNADMFVAFSRKSRCLPGLKEGFARALKAAVDGGKVIELLDAASDAVANP